MTERGSDELEREHEVTAVELFFDLVFVFAFTQVTTLLVHDPTWRGVGRGALVLAAVWWAWNAYAWLTSAADVDEGGVRLAMLAAMAVMLGVALAVPRSFGRDAALFGVAYFLVRLLHVVLSAIVARQDPASLRALLRFTPTATLGSALLVVAGFVGADWRIGLWVAALAIDYSGPAVIGMGPGWRVAPDHFSERYGNVILIALGESVIAIGVAARFTLGTAEVAAAIVGIVTVAALWWLYFDVAALLARRSLLDARGIERARLARDSFSYLHLPMIGGIVLFAFGLETTISHTGERLHQVAAVALCGGVALYLLAHIAFLRRAMGWIFRRRTVAAIVMLALIPAATRIPAIAALATVGAVSVALVGYEAIGRRADRARVRHPSQEPA